MNTQEIMILVATAATLIALIVLVERRMPWEHMDGKEKH